MSLYINKLITELIHLNLPEVSCSEIRLKIYNLMKFGLFLVQMDFMACWLWSFFQETPQHAGKYSNHHF